jgi:hypothetical protein
MFVCFNAKAGNFLWKQNLTSGAWEAPANWTNSTYPGAISGASDQVEFKSNATVTFNVAGPGTISNIIVDDGVVVTITIASGAKLAVTSSSVTALEIGNNNGNGASLTILGATASPNANFSVNGTIAIGTSSGAGSLILGSSSNYFLTSSFTSSTITFGINSPTGIYNYGTLQITSSTLTTGSSSTVYNGSSGVFTNTSSNIYLSGGSSSINNLGDFELVSSNLYLNVNPCTVTNQPGAKMGMTSSQLLFTGNSNEKLYNHGTFNANSGANIITMQSAGSDNTIYNYGTFNAGTFGGVTPTSSCIITMQGTRTNVINTSTTVSGTTYNGAFNLGSISVVNLSSANNCQFENDPACAACTVTLMSDANGSATIGTITSGSSAQGTFNVQRYITPGYRGYRLFSCPVNTTGYTPSSSNVIDLSYLGSSTYSSGEFIAGPGTGFGSNGTLSHTIANPTIYLYQETALPGANYNQSFISGKNIGIYSIGTNSVTTISTATNGISTSGVKIPPGNGYISYFIGPYNITSYTSTSPVTATTTAPGYINQGTIPLYLWGTTPSSTLTYTTGTGSREFGYEMIGNPYPSSLDLYALYNDTYNSSNNQKVINASFYEFNDQSQSYVAYNAITGSSGTGSSRYVASGQGFLISVVSTISTLTNKTLTFTESDKPASTSSAVFPSTLFLAALHPSQTNVSTGLHLKLIKDNINYRECGLYFRSDWKDTYEEKYDAYDLDGVSPKVFLSSFSSDGIRTSINALSDYTYGKRIKLFVKATTDGIYKLNLEDMTNIDTTNYNIFLIDRKLNDSLDMAHYKTYTFNLYTADTASFTKRFLLAIEPKLTRPYNLITFSGQKGNNNTIQLNWNTANEGNYTTFGLEKLGANGNYTAIDSVQSNGSGVYSFNDQKPIMGNNIYRLAQNDIHGKVTFSGPININYNTISVSGMFTIYPNPSKDIVNISVNSGITGSRPTPVYLASIYNLSGVVMDSKQVNTNNWAQDISGYKAGVYILELKTAGGDIVGKAKFVKTN